MKQCYLCKNNTKIIRKKLRNDIKRNVLQCRKCGLVFLEPKEENLKKFYKNYRKLYTPIIGQQLNSKDTFDLYCPLQESRVRMARKYLNKRKTVLDIGCSSGHFLFAVKNMVKECMGIEFNLEDAEFVNKKLGIKCYTDSIEKTDLPKKHFDLIFCLQTLEHIENPLQFLRTIKDYLKDDGIVYIEVPNIQDALLSVYKNQEYQDFYYREPHLFYYSPKTLGSLMNEAKYKGKVLPFQWYNFPNQMHWILARGPQKSAIEALAEPPVLIKDKSVSGKIKNDFNQWIEKIDNEYKKLAEKHFVSDQIIFIGKKK